ncbi:hypothetical protein [Vulcaniibacterium tengchongense]|uniref:Uncharacterized protein n=1 Tax=Vulcaniibacterium tengchongense TaxID=1273429 RepID=A0A3N4VAC4_9GAMM|nr:hypothetical protein [Vulcaniibacterium tengchongense]RPE79956.1 hypothetical protein EDC50_1786 [Vulcaniibacterium tengchongense]
MGTNKHARDRVESGRTTPPSGHDETTDRSHALRAGKNGPTQRKSAPEREAPTRPEGRDDHRSGSDKRH